jgi:hypothetical protein
LERFFRSRFHEVAADLSHPGIRVTAMKNADGALRRINFSMRNGIRIRKKGRSAVVSRRPEPVRDRQRGIDIATILNEYSFS